MSKSLQDQLLALGVAKPRPSDKARKAGMKPKQKPQQKLQPERKKPGATGSHTAPSDLSLEQAYRLREQQTKEQAEQARQRKRAEDRRRRQLNEEIRAIVEPHRLNHPDAELTRNFMYKGRIRKVNVTAEQLKAVNEGALGLVYFGGGYHILAPEYVEQVRRLSPEHVPDLSGSTDEDDEYPVPDDLVW